MAEIKIKFKIVTPEKTVFEDEVSQVTLPMSEGQVTILPNHRSYIASLKPGVLCFKKDGEETEMVISGGFIEFDKNNLVVLSDAAERAEEIDLKAAEEAKQRAEKLKEEKVMAVDDEEYARVAAAIEHEASRIKIAKKHYTKKGINLE
jgi:F-type H+-transporting ATPase subunit epsilon